MTDQYQEREDYGVRFRRADNQVGIALGLRPLRWLALGAAVSSYRQSSRSSIQDHSVESSLISGVLTQDYTSTDQKETTGAVPTLRLGGLVNPGGRISIGLSVSRHLRAVSFGEAFEYTRRRCRAVVSGGLKPVAVERWRGRERWNADSRSRPSTRKRSSDNRRGVLGSADCGPGHYSRGDNRYGIACVLGQNQELSDISASWSRGYSKSGGATDCSSRGFPSRCPEWSEWWHLSAVFHNRWAGFLCDRWAWRGLRS